VKLAGIMLNDAFALPPCFICWSCMAVNRHLRPQRVYWTDESEALMHGF